MIDTQSIPGAQITLWALLGFSVATWSLILVKAWQQYKVGKENRRFSTQFWEANDLGEAARSTESAEGTLARLAKAGFGALSDDGSSHNLDHQWDRQELLERHLRQQIHREHRGLETGLTLLASIGSTAPFVGLFGTVWGIMNALTHIGKLGNASIDVVAGPIGEALVATGIGIAVAVPAVLAYNFFVRKIKLVSADLDDFATDFLNLAQRANFRHPLIQRADDGKVVELKAGNLQPGNPGREVFA
ncbi:MotA/TolQ/ExbB proton channel family protein [Burkholderiaceae bacterium DAT-1]|nr:MotA/TolQ/ExbB proton channel family protein [Burkholderiaceae bacterium DAT-1]